MPIGKGLGRRLQRDDGTWSSLSFRAIAINASRTRSIRARAYYRHFGPVTERPRSARETFGVRYILLPLTSQLSRLKGIQHPGPVHEGVL